MMFALKVLACVGGYLTLGTIMGMHLMILYKRHRIRHSVSSSTISHVGTKCWCQKDGSDGDCPITLFMELFITISFAIWPISLVVVHILNPFVRFVILPGWNLFGMVTEKAVGGLLRFIMARYKKAESIGATLGETDSFKDRLRIEEARIEAAKKEDILVRSQELLQRAGNYSDLDKEAAGE